MKSLRILLLKSRCLVPLLIFNFRALSFASSSFIQTDYCSLCLHQVVLCWQESHKSVFHTVFLYAVSLQPYCLSQPVYNHVVTGRRYKGCVGSDIYDAVINILGLQSGRREFISVAYHMSNQQTSSRIQTEWSNASTLSTSILVLLFVNLS